MHADTDRRQSDTLIVAIDPVTIVVMRARESDHLPGRQVPVPAIDRIGKSAVLRIFENELEELLAVSVFQLERIVLQAFDHLILPIVRKLDKPLAAELLVAGGV